MTGSPRRLVALGVTAVILAGFLIGWTLGLVNADMVEGTDIAVFVALGLLFLGALAGFLIEYGLIEWNLT